ncbi:TIGR03085 family metal-binding protein [Corynebacterium sp.]|uniref:TIGR03085 family metal-binding protein n=1 Tax=Corynebacterium sp. TaxID=1720 RepID=UPI0026DD4CE8|nr:TIGR03085 family metal-binding protein [Corynebacterium sp.]MDO5075734.1 TIGR03085 family metal-binding protein [Corynebacterium sp.]
MSFSETERSALAALFTQLGPDHPTVLPGWTNHDLIVHLVLRETRPDIATGMFVPALSGRLDAATEQYLQRDFHELVTQWAAGPPIYHPMRYLSPVVNTLEHFVHHEDVRRSLPGWRPRELSPADQQALYRPFRMMAAMLVGKSTAPVVLEPVGLPRIVAADRRGVSAAGNRVVHVSGPLGELVLWAFFREAVDIQIQGDINRIVRSSI